jgi:hypothetical protein
MGSYKDKIIEVIEKENNLNFLEQMLKYIKIDITNVGNDETRVSLTDSWDKRDAYNEKWAIAHKPIQEWHEKNNPCTTCTINKKDHWDDIHYNCELNHTHSCKIMIEHYDKLNEMRGQIKIVE